MRLTASEAGATTDEWQIAASINLCAGDPRIYGYLNQAQVRLLPRGQWRGTVVRYKFCVGPSACLTWPRQIESILAWSLCGRGGQIRSHYYEFLGFGPGQFNTSCSATGNLSGCSFNGIPCGSGAQLVDRGLGVAFDNICGTGKQIKVYNDLPVDNGKTILLQGLDENGNPVLTDSGDTPGEEVVFNAATPPVTNTIWFPDGLAGVQKEPTKGPIRLYEYDPITTLQRLLAVYEPDETLPEYRQSIIPGIQCGRSGSANCSQTQIIVLAKLKFTPVNVPTDYLLISNPAALKDMVQSVKKRQDNLISEAVAYEQSAVAELERELADFHGDGTSDPVATINTQQFGAGITSMI